MSKLFSLNSKKLIEADASYWERSIKSALDLYRNTKAESEEDLEARAVALASLAGLALAMHNHFGGAVEALGYSERQAMVAAGMKAYDASMRHSRSMGTTAEKSLN